MKKTIWITFFIMLVLVNALAWAVEYFGDLHIALGYRLVVVLAACSITLVFTGAWQLMNAAEREHADNTGRRQ